MGLLNLIQPFVIAGLSVIGLKTAFTPFVHMVMTALVHFTDAIPV